MANITPEQQIALEKSPRFQEVCKQNVKLIAQYLSGQDGTTNNLGGRANPAAWARERNIAAGIILHPEQQSYTEWASQMNMTLKGKNVWQPVTMTAYAAAANYAVGAQVKYTDGKSYQCRVAITNAPAVLDLANWDSLGDTTTVELNKSIDATITFLMTDVVNGIDPMTNQVFGIRGARIEF